MSQLDLNFNDKWRDEAGAERWRRELRAVVEDLGVKAVASDLDRGHSELSRALDEIDRHYLKPVEIFTIMRRDVTGRILSVLAAELGYEVSKRRELAPAEKLERLRSAIEKNPALARVLYEDAFGPGGKP